LVDVFEVQLPALRRARETWKNGVGKLAPYTVVNTLGVPPAPLSTPLQTLGAPPAPLSTPFRAPVVPLAFPLLPLPVSAVVAPERSATYTELLARRNDIQKELDQRGQIGGIANDFTAISQAGLPMLRGKPAPYSHIPAGESSLLLVVFSPLTPR
jgi:hypothetical protein